MAFFAGLSFCRKTTMGDFCPVTGVSRETLPGEYQGEKSRLEEKGNTHITILIADMNGIQQ